MSLVWSLALVACGGAVPIEAESCDACDGSCVVESIACGSAAHVEGGVDYADAPPVCGDHDPCWTRWGVHATDPGDEHWVHNLEHGGVVFLYDCDDCEAEVAALTELVEGRPDTILAPYRGLPTRFAALAWGWRWLADCADLEAMEAFYLAHRDRAPESVSSGPPDACM